MKRRPAKHEKSLQQPDLFEARGPAWLAEHWPQYARASADPFATPPLLLWATTFPQLPAGAEKLLSAVCHRVVTTGSCQASIPGLARATGSSANSTRQRLDRLLTAGIIALKPWTDPAQGGKALGYRIRPLVDIDDADAARADGFVDRRTIVKASRAGARCR